MEDGREIATDKIDIQLKEIKSENPYKPCEREPSVKSNGCGKDEEENGIQLRVYRRRWMILLVVALLNNTNTISWIAYASVSNIVNIFYEGDWAGYFSVVYMAVTIPVGFLAMWLSRKFGLRTAILIAAWTNGIGGFIRFSASFLANPYRGYVALSGQAIAAIAYPFIMFLPTKVAGAWFSEKERGLATTIGVMSNPLGVFMASVISPAMVTAPAHVVFLNAFTFVPSIAAAILATIVVKRSEPKIPPTFSAGVQQMDFAAGFAACFKNVQYIILLVVMGGGIGMFNCLYTVISELLCPSGYSNSFAGLCSALMIVGGVFGATASGIIVDRTGRYAETIKIAMAVAVIFGLTFLQLTLRPNLHWLIVPTVLLFGVLGLATYPVGLQLSAECTYPVSEETSTGLIVLMGQIQSLFYVLTMRFLYRDIGQDREKIQVCRVDDNDKANKPSDATVSIMVFSVIAALLALLLIGLFRPVYKRMEAENANRAKADKDKEIALAEKKLNAGLPNENTTTTPLTA
ncbi:unnamed protein product, partial [Mesorhabditis belari]|uniref:Major facilitator superfamily (MFS) profile domain-containing protein n=1 Tax=Mesorhabditis belari TaxID=2138241 RepID=A0AAF3FLB9_9BILA